MTKISKESICRAMGVGDEYLKECVSNGAVDNIIEDLRNCESDIDPETCYAKKTLQQLCWHFPLMPNDVVMGIFRWGIFKPDTQDSTSPTHHNLEEVLKEIFAKATPKIIAFGENHPLFGSSDDVKSALERFAEEAMPWLKATGYHTIVTEYLAVGTPESEFEKYKTTEKIDSKETPYLYEAYNRVRDPKGLLALLNKANELDLKLIGGGLTLEEINSEIGSVELMEKIRDNLLNSILEQGPSARVVVYSGALHNDIQPTTQFSFLNQDGLIKLNMDSADVAEVDIIIPEFANDPISNILATLAPTEEIRYRKINSTHAIVYAYAKNAFDRVRSGSCHFNIGE